jgi:endo-1,4-beta-xylanase
MSGFFAKKRQSPVNKKRRVVMFTHLKFKRVNNSIVILFMLCLHAALFQAVAGPIAEGSTKFLGNITNGNPASNYADYWNQITLENGGKWGSVQPSNQNSFSWSQTDAAYNYCKSKGWPFKHHCFVWGQQQPGWVNAGNAMAAVENYIKTYGSRYPETALIDVVNEPLHAPAGYREGLGGSGSTGWDWVVTVFQFARQYCPNSTLILNDYGIVNDMNATGRFLGIIKILQAKNLIDGIGVQSHCFNLEATNASTVKRVLDTLATTGLPIYSSEFDLRGDENTQLQRYKTFFPVFWEHRAVKGVTLWGYTNNWMDAVIMSGGREYAALQWLRTYVDSLEQYSSLQSTVKKEASATFSIVMDRSGRGIIHLNAATAAQVSLRIVDPSGKTVFASTNRLSSADNGTVSFSTKSLSKGCYAACITNGRTHSVRKVFIK